MSEHRHGEQQRAGDESEREHGNDDHIGNLGRPRRRAVHPR